MKKKRGEGVSEGKIREEDFWLVLFSECLVRLLEEYR